MAKKRKKVFIGIFTGNMLRYIERHRRYLIFLFVLVLAYIVLGLMSALEKKERATLDAKLLRSKANYNMRLAEFAEISRYSALLEALKNDLKEADCPPVKIQK
jgi:hypothetical protein